MKALILVHVVMFATISGVLAGEGTISVEVIGIANKDGQLLIGLYDKADGFPVISKAFKGVKLKVTGKSMTHEFTGLKPGDYAVAVIHDANKNNKLDKNFFGIPKEGYGFSNNAKGTLGPPSFDKAKFKLTTTHVTKIKMQN